MVSKLLILGIVFLAVAVFVTVKNFYLMRELWSFMRVRKKWWLLPLIIMILLVSILVIFSVSTPLSPFIYAFI